MRKRKGSQSKDASSLPSKKKNWSASNKALHKFVSTIKPGSYWKVASDKAQWFIFYPRAATANFAMDTVEGWERAVSIDLVNEYISREVSADYYLDSGHFYTIANRNIVWTKTNKHMFNFWWNLAKGKDKW